MILHSPAVQEVTAGSYEDAFKAAGIDAGKPGWHEFDILKYVKNTRPGKELGLNVNSAHPANYLFTSSEKNSWGNNRSYVIAPGSCCGPLKNKATSPSVSVCVCVRERDLLILHRNAGIQTSLAGVEAITETLTPRERSHACHPVAEHIRSLPGLVSWWTSPAHVDAPCVPAWEKIIVPNSMLLKHKEACLRTCCETAPWCYVLTTHLLIANACGGDLVHASGR